MGKLKSSNAVNRHFVIQVVHAIFHWPISFPRVCDMASMAIIVEFNLKKKTESIPIGSSVLRYTNKIRKFHSINN